MSIEERIANISPYFKEMKMAEGVAFIKVEFPKNWYIDHNLGNEKGIKIIEEKNGTGIFVFGDMKLGFSSIMDVIEKMIEYNKMAELKNGLMIEYIKELEELFKKEDLDVLETLEFKFKKRKTRKRKEEEITVNEDEDTSKMEIKESESSMIISKLEPEDKSE